jgi:hypothetical protein
MGRSTHPQVMESALRWSDGRRIFMGQSPVEGEMLFRMEADPLAVDDAVLTALDALEAAMVAALHANRTRASMTLHRAS